MDLFFFGVDQASVYLLIYTDTYTGRSEYHQPVFADAASARFTNFNKGFIEWITTRKVPFENGNLDDAASADI